MRNVPENIDINFTFTTTAPTLDVNYGVTSTSVINYAVWGFPNDNNILGLVATQNYRSGALREVCVVVKPKVLVNRN